MREGLIVSTVLLAIGYLGWAHAEWRIKRYLIRIDTLADELAQERAESKHHTTGSATCGRSSATAATNWNSTRTR